MTSFDAKNDKEKKKFLGILGHKDHRERSKSLSPKVKDEVKAALESETKTTDANAKSSSPRPKSATLNKNIAEEIKLMQQEEAAKQAKPSVVDTKIERLTNAELKKVYLELIAELKTTMETKAELKKQIAQLRQTLKMKPSLLSFVGLQEENDKLQKTNASLQKQIDAILKPAQPTSLTKVPSSERGRSKSLVPYLDKPADLEETEAESDETVLQYITELEAVNIDELPDRRIKTKFEDGRKILRRQLPAKKELSDEASNLQDALKMKPSLPQIMEMQNTVSRLKEHNKLLEEKLEQYKTNPPPPEPVEAAPATAAQAEPNPTESVPDVVPKVAVTVNNKPTSFDQPLDDIPNQLMVSALGARYLIAADSNGKSDPFCILKIGNWKAKTKVIKKTLEPQWNQSWRMDIREPEKQVLEVEVWDADVVGKPTLLGTASYALKDLPKAKEHCVWLKLQGVDSGEVNLALKALDWGKDEAELAAEKKPTWNLQDTMDFMKDINEKKVAISKLEKQLAELQKQLEAKDASLSDLTREKEEKDSLVKQLQAEIETAKSTPAPAQAAVVVTSQNSEVEESLKRELDQLKSTMNEKAKTTEGLQTKVTGLEAKITELESKTTGLESEKSFLKNKFDETLNEKTKIEAKLKEEVDNKTSISAQLEASNKKVSSLESQVKTLSESGNAGSAALQEAKKQNEKFSQENASLLAKLKELQQNSEKELQELKDQLKSKETQSQQLQQRLDDIEKAMETKNTSQELDMESLQKELAVLKTVNQNEKNKTEHLNTENNALRKQISELQALNKTLGLQSHELQDTTKTLQQQVRELSESQKQAKEKETVLSSQSEQAKKLENEVKRLKTLVEEKEAQIKMRWKPDFDAHGCAACNNAFTMLNRRHHCRNCGDVFCGTCSAKKSPTAKSVEPVRVCDGCFADILNSKV